MDDPDIPDLDRQIRWTVESFARSIDRRRFLKGAFQSGLAMFAGLSLGSITAATALAADGGCKPCNYLTGNTCGHWGYPCPTGTNPACPSGCTTCKNCVCQNQCCYAQGFWTVTGCGTCGNGSVSCKDCKCPDCAHGCTCRSACYCCNCCSPQDIVAELQRITIEEGPPAPAVPR